IDHVETPLGASLAPLPANPVIAGDFRRIEGKGEIGGHVRTTSSLGLISSMLLSPAKAAATRRSMPARSTGRGLFLISLLAPSDCSAIQGKSSALTPISANVEGMPMVSSSAA